MLNSTTTPKSIDLKALMKALIISAQSKKDQDPQSIKECEYLVLENEDLLLKIYTKNRKAYYRDEISSYVIIFLPEVQRYLLFSGEVSVSFNLVLDLSKGDDEDRCGPSLITSGSPIYEQYALKIWNLISNYADDQQKEEINQFMGKYGDAA